MENKRDEILEKLISFYSNFPSREGKFFDDLLHESCKYADECWKHYNDEDKKAPWNYFSLPFIGKEYTGELVCVCANVNRGGGRNIQELCIRGYEAFGENKDKKLHDNDIYAKKYDPGVIDSFIKKSKESVNPKQKPKTKIFFEKGMENYSGTELWHRIAAYSAILLEKCSPDVAYDFLKLAEIYERIIFMDAIKCSPATPTSRLIEPMEKLCIENIFFKELEIIKPKNILIMYKKGAKLIKENYKYIDGSKDFPGTHRAIDYCKLEICGEIVNVYYILHPSARPTPHRKGGNQIELFEELANFVKSKK